VPHLEELESRLAPASFTVNSKLDLPAAQPLLGPKTAGGDITLRSAIMAADAIAGPTTITVPPGTYQLTSLGNPQPGASGPLLVTGNVTIQGAGADQTVIDASPFLGKFPVFVVTTGTVLISGVHIEGGGAAAGNGGGISAGAGVGAVVNLTLRGVWISGNVATSLGNPNLGLGGGLFIGPKSTADVESSTFSSNTAFSGGGIYDQGQLTLVNSTISGNHLTGTFGGGLFVEGSAVLVNDTIADNMALVGAGLFSEGPINLGNTLLADNVGGNFAGGFLTDLGHNLDSDGSTGVAAAGDILAKPLLGLLGPNGGPTPTRVPDAGSPAIDAGASTLFVLGKAGNLVPATDQRGVARPAGPAVDIGAVEVAVPVLPSGAGPAPSSPPGSVAGSPIDPSFAVAILSGPAVPETSSSPPAASAPFLVNILNPGVFPGGRGDSLVNFTQSGGGDLPTLSGWVDALGQALTQPGTASNDLVRDEIRFGSLTAVSSPTILQALSSARRKIEDRDVPGAPLRRGKEGVEDIDLALQMVRPELKAIQMAESIFDGDDLVQQFAQFIAAGKAAPEAPAVSVNLIAPARAEMAAPTPGTEAVVPAGREVPWRLLFVPGTALLAAAIWLVVHRRDRKVSV
jgi:predicted outer membrane repeat protein